MHDSVYMLTAFFNLFIANFWVFYTLLKIFIIYYISHRPINSIKLKEVQANPPVK